MNETHPESDTVVATGSGDINSDGQDDILIAIPVIIILVKRI